MLHPAARAHGYRFHHHAGLGSISEEAVALARTGDAGRVLVVADWQTAGRGIAIKWPNDIPCAGAKLSGIPVEGCPTAQGSQSSGFSAVLGFGVNCASHPTDLSYLATHLGLLAGGGRHTRRSLRCAVGLRRRHPGPLGPGRNFAGIRRAWLDHALPQGVTLAVTRQGAMLWRHSRPSATTEG